MTSVDILIENATLTYNVMIKVPSAERIFFYSYLLPMFFFIFFAFAIFWLLTRRDVRMIIFSLPAYAIYRIFRGYVNAVTMAWIAMSSEVLAMYEAFAEQTAVALHSSLIWGLADYMGLLYVFLSLIMTVYMILSRAAGKVKKRGR